MKILTITAVHGRSELWDFYNQGIQNVNTTFESLGHQVDNYVVTSEEHEAKHFEELDYRVWVAGNEYLGEKWNVAFYYAYHAGYDYVLIMGSDNVIAPSILSTYSEYMDMGVEFFGLENLIVYEPETNRIKYHEGYPNGTMSMGAGRMHKVSTFKYYMTEGWKYNLATAGIKRGLDSDIKRRLRKAGVHETVIDVPTFNVIDIKTPNNLNGFDSFRHAKSHTLTEEERKHLEKRFKVKLP